MTANLEVSELGVRFGGLTALEHVSFALREGELVGLIGPNGAGKTTLLDAVTGFVRYHGSVSLCGDPVDALRPDQRASRGLRRTFQSLELFEDLTISENVAVGAQTSKAAVVEALEASGLARFADRLPATVPVSVRRFAALARAAATVPRVLLLDEVAAGLDRADRSTVAERLRGVASAGASVLLVDHDLGFVTELCDRVVVLDAGRVIASGTPPEVRRDAGVLAAYLGRRE